MKTHFGIITNEGDYESPLYCCETTLCGCTGEEPCENAVDDWNMVTCKKCLKMKDGYLEAEKINEEAICHQMGEMADFFEKQNKMST